MTVTSAVLVSTQPAPTGVAGNVYTSSGVTTIIDKFTAVNNSTTTAYTISVYLLGSGGAVSDNTVNVKTKTLQPLETYTFPEIVGHNLSPGGSIYALASGSAIVIRSSGRQVTQ